MSRLADVLLQGTHAARPAAAAGNTAYLYYETDTQTLFQSTGSAWVQVAAAANVTASAVGAVANAGNAPSLQVGVDASKPAAGTAGRLYVATDTGNLYEDSGSAWGVVATVQWANLTGKPSTFAPSAHESSHLSSGGDVIAREGLLPQVASSVESLSSDPVSPADGRTWLNTAVGALKARIAGVTEIINDWNALRNKPSTFTPATHTHPESDVTSLATDLAARVQLSPGSQQSGAVNVSGEVQGSDFKPGGVTGATAAARYHAATATGHPTTGTWQVGDIVPDQTGTFWFCTVAGTPGTWVQVGGTGGGGSSTLAGDTDVSISSPHGGQVLGYSDALSKWVNQQVAGVAATTSTAQLGADVAMTSANTYYDGPSVTLPPGIWLIEGVATIAGTTISDLSAKLWDGTTVYASGGGGRNPATASASVSIPLMAVVSPTLATTYKISAAADNGGLVLQAAVSTNGAGNNATYLRAIQLSGNPVGQQAPAVRCYNNSSTVSCATGAYTPITFDTNAFDQGTSVPQHSTSSNASRLTCQQSGVYAVQANVTLDNAGGGTIRALKLRVNGTTDAAVEFVDIKTASYLTLELSELLSLNVGDYVEVLLYQDSGGARSTVAGSNMCIFQMARIDSGPGAVQPNTKVQLDYTPTSDIANPATLTANTWNDIISNQTFNVDDQSSVIEIEISGMGQTTTSAPAFSILNRIVIDSAGTAVTKYAGGCNIPAASQFVNLFSGAGTIVVTGLSPGSHTIKFQSYPGGTTTLYCRPGTQPNLEFFSLRVLERKQSSSPPSSTPAPAVRCYNSTNQSISTATFTSLSFDTNSYDQGTSSPQHSTSSNTTRLVCQQAGKYDILGIISFAANTTGSRIGQILLNGTTVIGRDYSPAITSAGIETFIQVAAQYSLNVGDYVELQAYQDSGGALNALAAGTGACSFMMARIDTGGTGAVYVPVVKTANYTATATDGMLVAGASGLTFTLPAASSYGGKAPFVVKNSAFTNTVVAAAGTDTIDGASTFSLYAAQASVSLVADPAAGKWWSI